MNIMYRPDGVKVKSSQHLFFPLSLLLHEPRLGSLFFSIHTEDSLIIHFTTTLSMVYVGQALNDNSWTLKCAPCVFVCTKRDNINLMESPL